jgi:hypothetical protein
MPNFVATATVESSIVEGISVNDRLTADFMLDPKLTPIQTTPTFRFIDPWIFHVHRFVSPIAWLNGFTVEIPIPIPGPDPPPEILRVIAQFDNQIPPGSSMPNMPDQILLGGVGPGSQFVMNMNYPAGTLFPNGLSAPPRLPDAQTPLPTGGQLMLMSPTGQTMFSARITRIVPEPATVGLVLFAVTASLIARRRVRR